MKRFYGILFFPRIILCLTLFLLIALINAAHAAPTDFNGDGRSDLTLVKIVGNSLRWNAHYSPTDQSTTQVANLGKPGDHIALGQWTSTTSTQAGILTIGSNDSDVIWRIEGGESLTFGTVDDLLFIAGADFDGSGYTDAARIVRSGKKQVLQVHMDPFAPGGPGQAKELTIGKLSDKVFFFNPDGTRDRIALLRKKSNGKSVVRVIDVLTEAKSHFNVGEESAAPLPLADANGNDHYLVFAKKKSKRTDLKLRSATNGSTVKKTSLSGKGTLVIGDFLDGSAGQELAIQTSNGFTIYNPTNDSTMDVSSNHDIPVDHININTFGGSGGDDGGSGGGGGGNVGPGLSSVCPHIISPDSHIIYKTEVSDHINDSRQGGGSFLIADGGIDPSVSCISVYDADGTEITRYGFYYPPGSDWEARAYGKGMSCSSGENPFSVASEAHNNTGSYSGYFKVTGSTCIRIEDLRDCVNSSNC